MNIEMFKESLPYLFQANVAAMVCGHHGIGKSEAVRQYAEENGLEFVDLRLGTQDVGDLLGLADFERDAKGNLIATKFMRPEWFPCDPNSKGIIFMDEINRARRDVLQAVFQLVLDKKLHRYTLPQGWHVIAAMNPSTENYIVTDISDAAFMDRFCHIKFAPSKTEFFKYAKTKDFDPVLLQFLSDQPKLLQSELEEFSIDVKPSRRSWFAVNRLIKIKTPPTILQALCLGLVGPEATTSLMKAMKDGDKPITALDILENYAKFSAKIKEYSGSGAANRMDMLKFTCDSVLELAQSRKKALTKDEAKNLTDFLYAIPKDLSYSLCRELYMEDCTRPVIDDHTDLLTEIANKRGLKVKGVNA